MISFSLLISNNARAPSRIPHTPYTIHTTTTHNCVWYFWYSCQSVDYYVSATKSHIPYSRKYWLILCIVQYAHCAILHRAAIAIDIIFLGVQHSTWIIFYIEMTVFCIIFFYSMDNRHWTIHTPNYRPAWKNLSQHVCDWFDMTILNTEAPCFRQPPPHICTALKHIFFSDIIYPKTMKR